jgi:cytochrome c oxidase cbb3-type subunit 3
MSSHCLSAAACCLLIVTACQREKQDLRPAPGRTVVYSNLARQSEIIPGGGQPEQSPDNPYEGTAYGISEGQRLFAWYNCTGCHANGGGGIGPPLIKTVWSYGDKPANLFDTIVKGRPNGMPAWGGKIPEFQIWQLVTYIRSLNGQEPKSATPVRADMIEPDPHTLTPQPQAGARQ